MLDLITVVYQKELPLLEIQARSIDLHVSPQIINSIIVVVNDHQDVCDLIDASWYGQHQNLVKIILAPKTKLSGWDSQQLHKLATAGSSTQEWTMILDAKTWFVNDLNIDLLFDDSNRAYHCTARNFTAFNDELVFTEQFFQTSTNQTIIGPAGVPFMFHTKTVRSLIQSIENISDLPFDQWFVEHVADPPRITEFVLYSVYVLYKYGTYNYLYAELDRPNYLYFNICDWQVKDFDLIYNKILANINNVLTVSVHSRAYQLLSYIQKQSWLQLLVDKQLVNDQTNINTLY